MYHDYQLLATLVADRQTHLRNVAARHRMLRRTKLRAGDRPSARVSTIGWAGDADSAVNQQRVHCVA